MPDGSPAPRVYTIILGGGRGERLFPLTRDRAKPAVPLAGKYRLIDIPLSNAINSGFRDIAVLTQFNSASLNIHVARTYQFDIFSSGNVEVFAAQQTAAGGGWFEGTADAVRKHMLQLIGKHPAHVLVLSGDHLYRMDYRPMLKRHLESGADVTVSVIPVGRSECREFGILSPDAEGRIRAFCEKPATDAELDPLALPESLRGAWGLAPGQFVASMGVYIFRFETLRQALRDRTKLDFGKHILPALIASHKVVAHPFRGYWRDIGTIASFYEANLALTEENPAFRFALPDAPVYTRTRFLPSTKILDAKVSHSILGDGCLVFGAELDHCVVGVRARIQKGARLKETIVMGIDFHEEDDVRAANRERGIPDAGVGPDCVIERAILDKNARIGAGCRLIGAPGRPDADGDDWFVRDGIVIVPKDAVVAPGTVV